MMQDNESRGFWSDLVKLGRLWPYIKQNKKLLILAAFFIPLVGITQSIKPLISRWGIDDGIIKSDYNILIWAAVCFFVAVLFEYIMRAMQAYVCAKAVFKMIYRLRNKVIHHIMHLPARFHDKNMSGALVTRATSDFDNLSNSLNQGMLNAVVDIIVIISCVAGMFYLHPKIAFYIVIMIPLAVMIIAIFTRFLKRTMLTARKLLSGSNAFAQEMIYGQTTVKLLGAQDQCSAVSYTHLTLPTKRIV